MLHVAQKNKTHKKLESEMLVSDKNTKIVEIYILYLDIFVNFDTRLDC